MEKTLRVNLHVAAADNHNSNNTIWLFNIAMENG
jgi:hypothetical protein